MSPIPVHPNTYLATCIMRPDTLPSSNSFVNTFFFGDTVPDEDPEVVADSIKVVLDKFYDAVNPGTTIKLSSRLSIIIDPSLTEYRIYNLGVAAPRTPIIRDATVWTVATTALPNEVAAVISYRRNEGTVGGGTSDPKKRGRLFIGPLGQNAIDTPTGDQDARLTDLFRQCLTASAEYLLEQTDEPLAWLQYSRVLDAFGFVTGGFVNNRCDTQRRRGAVESARTVWPVTP